MLTIRKYFIPIASALGVMAVLPSCQTVSQLDQGSLTTPGRQFQERGAYGIDCGIVSQVESGRLGSGTSGSSGSC